MSERKPLKSGNTVSMTVFENKIECTYKMVLGHPLKIVHDYVHFCDANVQ